LQRWNAMSWLLVVLLDNAIAHFEVITDDKVEVSELDWVQGYGVAKVQLVET
jgi:hypothetical protein